MSFENWNKFLTDTIADLQADKVQDTTHAGRGSRRTLSKNTHTSRGEKIGQTTGLSKRQEATI